MAKIFQVNTFHADGRRERVELDPATELEWFKLKGQDRGDVPEWLKIAYFLKSGGGTKAVLYYPDRQVRIFVKEKP